MASPNMNLPIPVPSQTGGPQYAQDEVSCFNIIDAHNHSTGNGSPIPVSAIQVTSSFNMNSQSINNLQSISLLNVAVPPSSGSIYMYNDDLYWNPGGGGVSVQLTIGNAIAGATGNITNLVPPASVTFDSLTSTYIFESNVNTSAKIDSGSITLRNSSAGSNGIEIKPPSLLAIDYSISLPQTLPPSKKIVTLDGGGILAADYDVDNSTIVVSSNEIKVADYGITQTQMANNSIGTNQIIDGSVTAAKLSASALGFSSAFSSSGSAVVTSSSPYTLLTCVITTSTAGQNCLISSYSIGGGPPVTVGGLWNYWGGLHGDSGGGNYTDFSMGIRVFVNGPGMTNYEAYGINNNRVGSTTAGYICYNRGSNVITLPQVGTYTITSKIYTMFGGGGSSTAYWYNLGMNAKLLL